MEMSFTERLVALLAIVVLVAAIVGYHWLTAPRRKRKAEAPSAKAEAPSAAVPGSPRERAP